MVASAAAVAAPARGPPKPWCPAAQGRVVSFASAVVVMTSNVGSDAIAAGGGGSLGFQLGGGAEEAADSHAAMQAAVAAELKVRLQE